MDETPPVIRYATGEIAQVGDRVDFDGSAVVVEDVVASSDDLARWGLDEPGLMFAGEKVGLVFESSESCCWDSIVFLGRAT
jgi:hypothetical protein